MKKSPISLKDGLARVALAFLVLGMLAAASAVAVMPVAKAQSQATISVYPTQGSVGTEVGVSGSGFSGDVSISFAGSLVATTSPNSVFGETSSLISGEFNVPSVRLGAYTVTASDNAGDSASATFTVVAPGTTPIPIATPVPTSTPYTIPTAPGSTPSVTPYLYPTYQPTVKSSSGFWSPLTISIVAAVAFIACSVPTYLLYSRRGKGKVMLEQESPFNKTTPSATSSSSTTYTRYDQSTRQSQQSTPPLTPSRYSQPQSYGYSKQSSSPYTTMRSNQPSSYSQPNHYTKTCPRCKKVVRDDQNICPYCDKRLR